jgi:hypothetical protein
MTRHDIITISAICVGEKFGKVRHHAQMSYDESFLKYTLERRCARNCTAYISDTENAIELRYDNRCECKSLVGTVAEKFYIGYDGLHTIGTFNDWYKTITNICNMRIRTIVRTANAQRWA